MKSFHVHSENFKALHTYVHYFPFHFGNLVTPSPVLHTYISLLPYVIRWMQPPSIGEIILMIYFSGWEIVEKHKSE